MNDNNQRGSNSATKFRILGFNANSIGKKIKRQKVFHFLAKKNPDFIVVSDTRISKEIENEVKEEWSGRCIFNSFSSNSRGVAIFIRKDNTAVIKDTFNDANGNILGILMEYEAKNILLEGLYGPNEDCPNFYSEKAFEKIEVWEPDFSIFVGDFNVTLNPQKDNKNYLGDNNPQARNAIKDKMDEYNLIDIYRELNPDSSKFYWKKHNELKFARLDYFLISTSLLPYIEKADILTTAFSDHSPVILDIDFSKFKRGRGFWKFNNSLIKDTEYVKVVKECIKDVVTENAIVNRDPNYISNLSSGDLAIFLRDLTPEYLQSLELKINPQVLLDLILLRIRRETIKYSSARKKERQTQELLLLHELEILENRLNDNNHTSIDINEALQLKKQELEELYSYQANGAYVRARAKIKTEGERPTKLFCSLEKHNGVLRHIPKLIVDKEDTKVTITNQEDIEEETFKYYGKLFSCQDNGEDDIETFLNETCESCPRITSNQKSKMEGLLTDQEITYYIKSCKNNVSPGSTGYTNEFYNFFWRDLRVFILNSINHSFQTGTLPITQRLGILTLIPKGEKDKTFLKNWRPLTLLNSIYKILSGCIANRIKPCLETIIHGDQKGFVSNRYIGEAVRSTYDIIQWAKDNNKTGVILLIDFEKAYDSLSFSYINKCLKFLDFGEDLIKWVNILLNNFYTVINHCGNLSKQFNIGRGARQGDPIASYLFIISIEILMHRLRKSRNINFFKVNNFAHCLEIYADDCTIFLQPCERSLRKCLEILGSFHNLSGLKISVTKTKAIWFGSGHNNDYELCPDLKLDWDKNFKLLGINFHNNLERMETNFKDKIDEIKKLLNAWFYRKLTPYGKICLIKTLALSKLSHIALVIPSLEKKDLQELEKIIYTFLWDKKPDKVNRKDACLSENAGGLGLIDISKFWRSFKFSWFRRLLNTKAFWPVILRDSVRKITNEDVEIIDIVQFGPTKLNNIGKKLGNKFWKEVFCSVIPHMQGAIYCYPEKILMAPILENPLFQQNNKPIKYTSFPSFVGKNLILADFFACGTNRMLNLDQFIANTGCALTEEQFTELKYIFTTTFRIIGLRVQTMQRLERPLQPLLINIANITKSGCNRYYRMLVKNNALESTAQLRERKWNLELGRSYGVHIWNSIYVLCSKIRNENKSKWLQYQINRRSLFTNHRVNKFKPHISPHCSYCQNSDELVSHLFFNCNFTLDFWTKIKQWLQTFQINIPLDIKTMLFGDLGKTSETIISNYVILAAKHYIWRTKFQDNPVLNFNCFKNFFKYKLEDLKNAHAYEGKSFLFDQWLIIYDSLQ